MPHVASAASLGSYAWLPFRVRLWLCGCSEHIRQHPERDSGQWAVGEGRWHVAVCAALRRHRQPPQRDQPQTDQQAARLHQPAPVPDGGGHSKFAAWAARVQRHRAGQQRLPGDCGRLQLGAERHADARQLSVCVRRLLHGAGLGPGQQTDFTNSIGAAMAHKLGCSRCAMSRVCRVVCGPLCR